MRSVYSTPQAPQLEQDQLRQPEIGTQPQLATSAAVSELAYLILALALPIFAVAPLLYPGYIQTHQGFAPLWNIADLRANWATLSWIPYIGLQFDPLRSDGLLPYYLAVMLPLSAAGAVKVVVGGSWLLGGVGIFLWWRDRLGGPGALVAALVYVYLPYQIGAVYVRGAWGEAVFWGLLPWALWGLASQKPFSLKPALFSLFFLWLLLGLSQLGLTFWAFIFGLLLLLVAHPVRPLGSIPVALLGVITAAIIYVLLDSDGLFSAPPAPFADHFLYPSQLFSAYWGFGPSRPGWNDGLSLQLGLAAIGLAALGIFLWLRRETRLAQVERYLAFFLGSAVILILLQFQPSAGLWRWPIWPGQTLGSTLTYPWQLLGLIGLCLSVLAGATFRLAPSAQFNRPPLFGSIIILIILSVYSYLLPQFIQLDGYPLDRPQAELGEAQLTILDHSFWVVTSGHTVGLEQGETTIPLAVHGPLEANDTLVMKVAWQPLRPFEADLKVFIHLVDANDTILAQFDGQPQEGRYPTSDWISGEIIEDAYPVIFPADAPPGPYRVFIGLYDEPTLQRLSVPSDSAGRVIFNVR